MLVAAEVTGNNGGNPGKFTYTFVAEKANLQDVSALKPGCREKCTNAPTFIDCTGRTVGYALAAVGIITVTILTVLTAPVAGVITVGTASSAAASGVAAAESFKAKAALFKAKVFIAESLRNTNNFHRALGGGQRRERFPPAQPLEVENYKHVEASEFRITTGKATGGHEIVYKVENIAEGEEGVELLSVFRPASSFGDTEQWFREDAEGKEDLRD